MTVTPTTSDGGIFSGFGGSALNTNLCLPSGTGPTYTVSKTLDIEK
jgi:hypothetical protein